MTSPFRAVLGTAVVALAFAACSPVPSRSPAPRSPDSRYEDRYAHLESPDPADLDVYIEGRDTVGDARGGSLLRVRFSFVSYRGYVSESDVHRSSGVVWFPQEAGGKVRFAPGEVVLTEFPPGSSLTRFSVHEQYGARPASELGVASAVVDVRGPIVRELRLFANPDDPSGGAFTGEDQFGYAMLRSYQENGDLALLWEHRIGEAWLRAIRAVDEVVAAEGGSGRNRHLLVGERWGAFGAVQAAASDPAVGGLVLCGWPLDWPDYHFTRWRRWERAARWKPLAAIQPSPYRDSREVLSFLFSSWSNPDPGCPSCTGTGEVWRARMNYLDLFRAGRLDGVRTLVLVGDSDPEMPIDLEARASVPPEALAPIPEDSESARSPARRHRGPFAVRSEPFPFDDLRYLDGASTIAHPEAIEATLAWVQHLGGYRDVPLVLVAESIEDGDVRLDITVQEGSTSAHAVEVRLTEIEGRHDSDFKHRMHRSRPEPVVWRRFEAIYAGHRSSFTSRWKAFFPVNFSRNRAYVVTVRDRVGELEAAHSLPARPLWNLGDPAVGRAR